MGWAGEARDGMGRSALGDLGYDYGWMDTEDYEITNAFALGGRGFASEWIHECLG